jgi:RimJ/RimL family protein N-acetyltransferase
VIFLETQRLRLRRFTLDDADRMIALNSDPEVMRYLSSRPVDPKAVREELMPRLVGEYDRFGGLGCWAGLDTSNDAFVGWFMLRPTPESERTIELGYRLARSAWGRGLATEAARALVDKAFAEHDAREVVGFTMTINAGSRRVLEKAGLTFVRTFYQDWPDPVEGDEHGDVEYALKRETWQRTAAPEA